jgi:hypothetical protein
MQQIFNFKVEKRTIKRLYIQDILILVRKIQLESIFLPSQN